MEYRKISLEELDKLKNLYAYENFEEFKKLIINDISNGIKNIFVIEENKNLIGEITVTYKSDSPNETIKNIRVYLGAFRIHKAYQNKGLGQRLLKYVIEEIEKELNVPKEDIIISMDAIQEPISLQEPVYGDNTDNIYVMDQISDKKNTDEHWADSLTISSAIQKLNDKEKMIINKRFFEGRTQMEVADEIGISQAQVSRLEKNAIDHIKRIYKQN